MNIKHLTDKQIQDYLESNLAQQQADIEAHLKSCRHCRQAVSQYKVLFRELADDDGFKLPDNFAKTVVSRLDEPQESSAWSFGLIVGSLSLAAIAIYFFIDYGSVVDAMARGFQTGFGVGTSMIASVNNFFVAFNVHTNLLLAAGMILLLFGWLDKVILLFKRSKAMMLA